MILYDNKALVIPAGLSSSGQGALLQDKSILITANGREVIVPDTGYDGLSKVTIDADIPSDIKNQEKTIFVPVNKDTVITPDEGFTGISKVTAKGTARLEVVDFPVEANGSYTVVPHDNFDAISKINIEVDVPVEEIKNQTKTVQVPIKKTTEITPDLGYTGLDKVTVTATANLEYPNVTATENNTSLNIVPGEGYDAIGGVNVTVKVPSDIKNQSKTVDPSTYTQIVTADPGYTGLDKVTVNPYKIEPRRVTGALLTYEAEDIQADYYNIQPAEGYKGIKEIDIRKTGILREITLDPSTDKTTWDARIQTKYQHGVRTVNVNPVTSSIDPNIVPENIKKGTTILGVEGSYSGAVPTGLAKILEPYKYDPITPSVPYINLSSDDLNGLVYLRPGAFNQTYEHSIDFNLWANVRSIEFPESLVGMGAYPILDITFTGDIDFSKANISRWPRKENTDRSADLYPTVLRSTIEGTLTFPKTLYIIPDDVTDSHIIDSSIGTIDLSKTSYIGSLSRLAINCSIKVIKLPKTGSISNFLYKCTDLTDIYYYGSTVPEIKSALVGQINTGGTLHVLKGAYDIFNNSPWMDSSRTDSFAHFGWTLVDDL